MPDLKVVTPAPSTRLETLVEDYLAHCRAKGLSPKTIRDNYGYALKGVFLPWAAQDSKSTFLVGERLIHGGDLQGFVLLRGDSERLARLRGDREFHARFLSREAPGRPGLTGYLSCMMPSAFLPGSVNQAIKAKPMSAMPSTVCRPGMSYS